MARPKKQTKRRPPSSVGTALKESLKEAVEWARGERVLPVRTYRPGRGLRLPPG
jgi:hypothetical protein